MSIISGNNNSVCEQINSKGEWITISNTEARLEFTDIISQWCQCVKGELVSGRCFLNSPICPLSPCDSKTTTCSIITTGYSCKCQPNFSFMKNGQCRPLMVEPYCSSKTDSCVNKTFDPNCNNTSTEPVCVCPADMEKLYFPNLSNKASLKLPTNNFQCIDVSSCELTGHHCDSQTTSCYQSKNHFVCQCREGFEKLDDFFECSDINECLEEGRCSKETSVCRNTFGGYKCECFPGYKNIDDHTCTVYNKCLIPKLDPCHLKYEEEINKELIPSIIEKDSCIFVSFDMYQCRCAPGFRFYNQPWGCEDIDECAEKTHNCTPESQCVNTRGGYQCKCLPGYKMIPKNVTDRGPQVSCKDINECEEGVLTQDKGIVKACNSQSSVCRNTKGSFECDCFEGYRSILKSDKLFTGCPGDECCQDIDECKTNTHNCTDHCVDGLAVPNNFTCDCKTLRFPKTPFECENCQYTDYGPYGDVNTTCGTGYRNASRKPLPGYGLEFPECNKIEDTMIFLKHNRAPCNEDDYKCTLSPWTVWSKCELKYNEGSQYQTRYIISGPRNCEKTLIRYQKCKIPSEPLIIDWNGIILGSLCVTLIFITLAACVRRSLVRRHTRNYF